MEGEQTTPRNWSMYNLSQTSEKQLAFRILNEAVDSLNIPYGYKGNGRPPLGLDDMIKACCVKVFNCFSSRRSIHDMEVANALGYIRQVPHFNMICKYMRSGEIVPYLHQLYVTLAMPLIEIENNFAVDATGFGTFKKNWLESKGKLKLRKDFKKLHITSGIRTNIITSAEASYGTQHDSPYFENLIRDTSYFFKVKQVYADAGYLSRHNVNVVSELGARPFIMPKSNVREPMGLISNGKLSPWLMMIKFWKQNEELFKEYYHKRSNVESSFSMMKRKFLPYVRSKDTQAQFNELIFKVVCHNLSVLVNSIFELDVIADFKKKAVAVASLSAERD